MRSKVSTSVSRDATLEFGHRGDDGPADLTTERFEAERHLLGVAGDESLVRLADAVVDERVHRGSATASSTIFSTCGRNVSSPTYTMT